MKRRKKWTYRLAAAVVAALFGCGMLSWNTQAFVSADLPVKQELPAVSVVSAEQETSEASAMPAPVPDNELLLPAAPCIVVEDNAVKVESAVQEARPSEARTNQQQTVSNPSQAGQDIVKSLEIKGTPKENYKIAETDPDIVLDAVAFTSGPPEMKGTDKAAVPAKENKASAAPKTGKEQRAEMKSAKAVQGAETTGKTQKQESKK